jgi:hypothetical protein
MKMSRWLLVFAILAAGTALSACNNSGKPQGIGSVSRVQGEGVLKRGDSTSKLSADLRVRVDDDIVTAADARAELTFIDGTKLTIGEQSQIKIDSFLFEEGKSGNRLSLNIAGPFRYVSGKLSAREGGSVSVRTPVATLGVRGTDFWGGPIDQRYGVFLLEGSVSVTTAAGEVVLTAPGTGVDVPAADQPPGPIVQWGQEKVDRAIATVTFPSP